MENIFLITTLFIVFAAAIVGAVGARKLTIPMLLGYIAAGVVFGNVFPRWIDQRLLATIADTGVILLLFALGVEVSFQRLRKVITVIGSAAAVQILLSTVIFSVLFLLFRFAPLPSLYLGLAASLSSTTVVVKLLSERGELESLPGTVLTGWLVVQDLAVIPIMTLLPSLVGGVDAPQIWSVGLAVGGSLVKAGFVIMLVIFLGKHGIPKLLSTVAGFGSREVFLVTTVAIVFLSAVLMVVVGMPAALGAFIAGLLVSETSQHHAVFAEIRPLRDVFAVVFFVAIGMTIPLPFVFQWIGVLAFLAIVVCLVKWVIVMGLMRFLGYHRKTAFLVALGLTQMSEFGFIIARVGVNLKALSADHAIFLISLTFLTMFIGSPLLSRGHRLYYLWEKTFGKSLPKFFPQKEPDLLPAGAQMIEHHVVICGYGRVGKYVGRALFMAGIPFLVVDYNHTTVTSLRAQGLTVIYGDPADPSVLAVAGVKKAKSLIVAIPDKHTQEMVVANAQTLNKQIRIISRIHHEEDQPRLKSLGVTHIVQPEFEAAIAIVERLLPDFGVGSEELPGKIARLKIEHGVG
ncbi:cation:proton antiporter [Candidatus Gottesmanbacteria bacterium]|nr:cation:proton antiporter [Candidatus Gottesmanbacteria bacterium]